MNEATATKPFPTFYIPHGGGPCFFMECNPPDLWDKLAAFLKSIPGQLPEKPKAIVVISGHWEEPVVAVNAAPAPPLLFDYYNFPPQTYELTYPVPGAPELAGRIAELLEGAGIPTRKETERGLDHGVFVPFKLIYPDADIPLVQVSMHASYNPVVHMAMGQALAPLRQEGVLIVGSGMSYHNLRRYRSQENPDAVAFDEWLNMAATAPKGEREKLLAAWEEAPGAREAHPREDHLVPLFVAAGAAIGEPGTTVFNDNPFNAEISGFRFG